MYAPSEAVFYELCNLSEVMEYARKLRVYTVSPSTLYAHLQMILLSFEGKKIESAPVMFLSCFGHSRLIMRR
jgi:DNA recombination protein RmuC